MSVTHPAEIRLRTRQRRMEEVIPMLARMLDKISPGEIPYNYTDEDGNRRNNYQKWYELRSIAQVVHDCLVDIAEQDDE